MRVTAKAGRDAIEGTIAMPGERSALAVKVRAAPDRGKANDAVIAIVARACGVPPSRIELVRGAAGRVKTLRIAGGDGRLAAALAARFGAVP